jgi:lysophospholipase L1-like esterase
MLRLQALAGTVLLVAAAFGVSLVALETGFRIFKPQKSFTATVNTWDPVLGTRQVAGGRGFVTCPEYDIDLVINSHGLRDREYPYAKPGGTRRILCLGDSYTCGYGVEVDETFPKVMEGLLNATPASHWEVINAGVGSTGTAQQLAYFEAEGCRYGPDLVVLCFCPANDFNDNLISGMYSLDQGRLVRHPAVQTYSRRLQRLFGWIPARLYAKSHFLSYLKYKLTVFHIRRLASKVEHLPDPQTESERLDALAGQLLLELRDACAANSSRLAVAVIPPPPAGGLPQRTADLIEFLHRESIPCLDLTPYFSAEERRGVQTFHPRDGHWNRTGHQLAARAIVGFLAGQSLLEGRSR